MGASNTRTSRPPLLVEEIDGSPAVNINQLLVSNGSLTDNGNGSATLSTAGGGGEANTASNVGVGTGTIFKQKTGVDLELKTLLQGANITITNNASDITIAATAGASPHAIQEEGVTLTQRGNLNFVGSSVTVTDGGAGPDSTIVTITDTGEVNTVSNVGAGAGLVFKQKTGVDFELRSILAGTAITVTNNANDITVATTAEANTASNVGTGTGLVFKQKTGVDLEFKSILQGTAITVTNNASDITIATTAEANTASNVGAGAGTIFKQKTGVDLEFKSILNGGNVTITNNASDITLAVAAPGETNTASNVGAGSQVFKQKTGVDLEFRTLVAGSSITLTQNANDITIALSSSGAIASKSLVYALMGA